MSNVAAIFESDLPEFLSNRKAVFIYIEGDNICDKKSFFQEMSLKMKFPSYFGFNWDAFRDCITDLSWLPMQNGLVVVYKNPNRFMGSQPEDWNIANEILLESINFWKNRNIPMFIMYA
ncbi:MAG: barstar family protein [Desulfamplus sp.]|nr:barstar family protein [Desulfamplus sp.]